jgi:hypothetical protein
VGTVLSERRFLFFFFGLCQSVWGCEHAKLTSPAAVFSCYAIWICLSGLSKSASDKAPQRCPSLERATPGRTEGRCDPACNTTVCSCIADRRTVTHVEQ